MPRTFKYEEFGKEVKRLIEDNKHFGDVWLIDAIKRLADEFDSDCDDLFDKKAGE